MTNIYFAQAGGSAGAIKIGFSSNVQRRLDEIRTGNHLSIELLGAFPCSDARAVEAALHEQFAEHRLEGEWFRCHSVILDVLACFELLNGKGHGERFKENVAATDATVLGREEAEDLWCVLFSHRQGFTHIETLQDHMEISREMLLFGRAEPNDYAILFITDSQASAHAVAAVIEPWLRALRFVRKATGRGAPPG